MDVELSKMLIDLAVKSSSNLADLRRFIIARGINRLFHFTSIKNLPSIAQYGFLGREELLARSINYIQTDLGRTEPIPNAICFSLSKPNQYMMLNKIKAGRDLVLLSLKNPLEILSNSTFLASPGNFGRFDIKLRFQSWPEEFIGGEGLSRLFLNSELRGKYALPQNEPTDARSELIVLNPVPWKFVEAIYSPRGKEYASQEMVREFMKTSQQGLEFRSQHSELFKDIDWSRKEVENEYFERTWSDSWI